MKRQRVLTIALVIAVLVAMEFATLWMLQRQDHSDLEELCQYSAYRAYDRFSRYRDDGSEYDYDYGVAELTSFYNSYMNLVIKQTDSSDTNCIYLNSLLGELMDKPDLTQEQINMLVTIAYELSQNISDINTYDDVFYLYNQLAER